MAIRDHLSRVFRKSNFADHSISIITTFPSDASSVNSSPTSTICSAASDLEGSCPSSAKSPTSLFSKTLSWRTASSKQQMHSEVVAIQPQPPQPGFSLVTPVTAPTPGPATGSHTFVGSCSGNAGSPKAPRPPKKRRVHPSLRPLTEANLRHQEVFSHFTLTFGTGEDRKRWSCESNISPGCSRRQSFADDDDDGYEVATP